MLERTPWVDLIRRALRRAPVVALVGSRQVGKTTLARSIAAETGGGAVHLDLELPSDRRKLDDPEVFLRHHARRLVVLDEVQRVPDIFPVLRALVDEDRRPGRFLVLGSAAPSRLGQPSESLAGRIETIELPPFWIGEVEDSETSRDRLWLRGGYPPSFLARNDSDSFAWREQFVRTYLERDLPQLGVRVAAETLRRFLTMVAHFHGRIWNAADVARGLGVTGPTVARYLDALVDACLVRRLPPVHANLKKRLVKSPKIYLRDSGLLHAILGLADRDALLGHPSVGPSFEGFAIEQVLLSLHEHLAREAAFFRTHAGAELDLVVTLPRGRRLRRVGIEVKHSSAPQISRGVHEAMRDLGCERVLIVVPRGERYPASENIHVVPLRDVQRGGFLL